MSILKTNYAVICLILFLNSSIFAMDLREALTKAYDNNDAMQIARRDYLNDIEAFPQAIANFLPDISAKVSSTNNRTKDPFTTIPGTDRDTLENSITLSQPIFRGGASVAALKAAQASFGAARSKYYSSEQSAFLAVIEAYLNYVESCETDSINAMTVASNKKQLEAITEKLKVGEATETDVATATSALSIAETNKLRAYANMLSSKAAFTKLVGTEPTDIVNTPELPKNLPKTIDELLAKALKDNPTIIQLRSSLISAKAGEEVSKAALLPNVDFKISGEKTNAINNISRSPKAPTSTSVTSVLSVDIPIYSRTRSGGSPYSAIRTAKNQTRKTVYQLDDALKQTRAECISSWEGFNAANSGMHSADKGIEAAEIAYNGTVEEEKVGSKSILDVLNAEDRLNQAKTAKIRAKKEYILSAYKMSALVGRLTAKSIKLDVAYFEPELEFKRMKAKIIGF